MFLGSNLVTLASHKQRVVSRSSTEAEYRALADGVSKVTWIESLVNELHISLPSPPVVYCDNLTTVQLASNHVLHARTKHVEIDHYFVRKKSSKGTLKVYHVLSGNQLVDPLTKVISTQKYLNSRTQMMILPKPVASSVVREGVRTSYLKEEVGEQKEELV